MPYSAGENRSFVRDFVVENKIGSVLDVGPGAGMYADMFSDLPFALKRIDAIEIWEPYIDRFNLQSKYDLTIVGDVRDNITWETGKWDLIIFGDVLEHMTEDEALSVWTKASYVADWGLISVPIIHYPQGEAEGNPYERHVQEDLNPQKIEELFGPFNRKELYSETGTFIKRFA
mgnify:CR=1 FL=1